jgi:hypothetical protein
VAAYLLPGTASIILLHKENEVESYLFQVFINGVKPIAKA